MLGVLQVLKLLPGARRLFGASQVVGYARSVCSSAAHTDMALDVLDNAARNKRTTLECLANYSKTPKSTLKTN